LSSGAAGGRRFHHVACLERLASSTRGPCADSPLGHASWIFERHSLAGPEWWRRRCNSESSSRISSTRG
jgi:hypothetical protein